MPDVRKLFAESHLKVVDSLFDRTDDLLLFYAAIVSMKSYGHRYGSFLDAASMAAKLAVYVTYLEEGKNQRRTGTIHHIEPRRVRSIVREVETRLSQASPLNLFGSREPQYLIGVPYLWIETFPYTGQDRTTLFHLSSLDKQYISSLVNDTFPQVMLISEEELIDLLQKMHDKAQADLITEKRTTLSDAMLEYMKFCLIDSKTVLEVRLPECGITLFLLAKTIYAPNSTHSRIRSLMQDVLRYFRLARLWAYREGNVFRGIETFCIKPEMYDSAVEEIDNFIKYWADKYHCEDQQPTLLQLIVGKQEPEDFS